MYDNRGKKRSGEYKASAPDFKCKECGHMIGGFASKGGGNRGGGQQRSAPPQQRNNSAGSRSFPPRDSNRIERQHSQEMAIRLVVATRKETGPGETIIDDENGNPDLKKLRFFIDWFQKDCAKMPESQKRQPEPNPYEQADMSEQPGSPYNEPAPSDYAPPEDDDIPY